MFVHSDELDRIFRDHGFRGTPKWASHVEPVGEGQWQADLSPVGGPLLGPYDTRTEAIQAEVDWLNANLHKIPKEFFEC